MLRLAAPLTLCALVLAACGGSVESQAGDGGGGGSTSPGATTGTGTATGTGTSTGPGATTGTGGSGGSGGGSTSTGTTSVATSTSTGTTGCTTHEECPDGLCIFYLGECAPACGDGDCESCDAGTVCDRCATSSCPDCDNCLGACVPPQPGQCDDDTPCQGDDVCMFQWGQCYPPCEDGACSDPNMVCDECATGSCCGCRDCVAVCLPLEG